MCVRFKNQLIHLTRLIMSKRLRVDVEQTNVSQNVSAFNLQPSEVRIDSVNEVNTMSSSFDAYTHLIPPVKSYSDTKEYSVIKLKNGLTALIISDTSHLLNMDELRHDSEISASDSEESERRLSRRSSEVSGRDSEESQQDSSCDEDTEAKQVKFSDTDNEISTKTKLNEEKLAACALCIGVGSFSDPEHIQGLAHFLEHMIFMGSEKYSKENEFDVFIKMKGGSDNASTECEYTTYYFDCHEVHLLGAMDIFSQLFISPLMKKETMTKEREAIESEFQMALPSDESRRSQILCSLASINNPVHKFMWGNLVTLRDKIKDDDLYKAVHEFRKRHYSAHRMHLAVQARLPMETLEKWVNECFESVPNNGLSHENFDSTLPPFKSEEFAKLFIIEPVKNINQIDLTWVLPSTLHMYKKKPLSYLSWIIGHEGKGSLLSYLRRMLWSFNVTVSAGGDGTEENSIYTFFTISLVITQEGVEHIEDILVSVFEYISMLRNNGPQERIFREIQLVAETAFKFSEEVSSADNVEQLSENMHFYPSVDYITGPELYFDYDPDLIKSLLNEIKADNVNVAITSKILSSRENLDKVEPWFGTKYLTKEIPDNWISSWKDSKLNKDFHLPDPNPFIASNLSILPVPKNQEDYPKIIDKDEIVELWYKQDVTFKLPYAFCCLNLVSPLSRLSAKNAAMLDLFISVLKQSLAEKLYPANVAQLEYGFHLGEKGISIVINGFNDKLKILLQEVITGVKATPNDQNLKMFKTIKEELKREYANANLKTSFLSREIRMSILVNTYWTYIEKEQSLKDITFEEMKDFISEYFKHLYIQCLIQGNVSKEEAIEYIELVKSGFSTSPLMPNTAPEIKIRQLPQGERVCVVHSFNPEDANSVVTNYYQSSLGSIHESCIIELLLMIMEEPLFDSLRTKQQLGYDVSCSLRDTYGVLGFSISVHCQSDRNSVDLVQNRITQFLEEFLQVLKNTTIEDFQEVQESLVKLKKCADIHLKQEVKRNWDEIKTEEYVFDRHHKEIECIKKLTLADLIEWFSSVSGVFDPSTSKKLSTQVVGQVVQSNPSMNQTTEFDGKSVFETVKELSFVHQQETSNKFITNINDFKNTLSTYPVHKIVK